MNRLGFKASVRADVDAFADWLGTRSRVAVVHTVLWHRLMQPTQAWVGVLVWVAKRRGKASLQKFLEITDGQPNSTFVRDVYVQTIRHIIHGKDREDRDSVGGFSQREMDLIVTELSQ